MALTTAQLADALRLDAADAKVAGQLQRIQPPAEAAVLRFAPQAPEAIRDEATIRLAGYLYDAPTVPQPGQGLTTAPLRASGAAGLLAPYRRHRLGITGAATGDAGAGQPSAAPTIDTDAVETLIHAALAPYATTASVNAAIAAIRPSQGGGGLTVAQAATLMRLATFEAGMKRAVILGNARASVTQAVSGASASIPGNPIMPANRFDREVLVSVGTFQGRFYIKDLENLGGVSTIGAQLTGSNAIEFTDSVAAAKYFISYHTTDRALLFASDTTDTYRITLSDYDIDLEDFARRSEAAVKIEARRLPDEALVDTFTELKETPNAFTGHGGKYLAVNAGATAVEFVNAPSGGGNGAGATAFTGLTDTPSAYTGQGGKHVTVNAAASALEFSAGNFLDVTHLEGLRSLTNEGIAANDQVLFYDASAAPGTNQIREVAFAQLDRRYALAGSTSGGATTFAGLTGRVAESQLPPPLMDFAEALSDDNWDDVDGSLLTGAATSHNPGSGPSGVADPTAAAKRAVETRAISVGSPPNGGGTFSDDRTDVSPRETNLWYAIKVTVADDSIDVRRPRDRAGFATAVTAAYDTKLSLKYRAAVYDASGNLLSSVPNTAMTLFAASNNSFSGTNNFNLYQFQIKDVPVGATIKIEKFKPVEFDLDVVQPLPDKPAGIVRPYLSVDDNNKPYWRRLPAGLQILHDGPITGLSLTNLNSDHQSAAINMFNPAFDLDDAGHGNGEFHVEMRLNVATRSNTNIGFDQSATVAEQMGLDNGIAFASTVKAADVWVAGGTIEGVKVLAKTLYANSVNVGEVQIWLVRDAQNRVGYVLAYDAAGAGAAGNCTIGITFECSFTPSDAPVMVSLPTVGGGGGAHVETLLWGAKNGAARSLRGVVSGTFFTTAMWTKVRDYFDSSDAKDDDYALAYVAAQKYPVRMRIALINKNAGGVTTAVALSSDAYMLDSFGVISFFGIDIQFVPRFYGLAVRINLTNGAVTGNQDFTVRAISGMRRP